MASYLVGAASSREFRFSTVVPRFIAAESRSHQGKITQLKAKLPILH